MPFPRITIAGGVRSERSGHELIGYADLLAMIEGERSPLDDVTEGMTLPGGPGTGYAPPATGDPTTGLSRLQGR